MVDKNRAGLPDDIKTRRTKNKVVSENLANMIITLLRCIYNKIVALRILDLLIYKLQERRSEFK
jgi:hypothetical protein